MEAVRSTIYERLGGPQSYSRKDMLSAHRGMNISESEYMHTLDDILKVLDKNNIDGQTKKWSSRYCVFPKKDK